MRARRFPLVCTVNIPLFELAVAQVFSLHQALHTLPPPSPAATLPAARPVRMCKCPATFQSYPHKRRSAALHRRPVAGRAKTPNRKRCSRRPGGKVGLRRVQPSQNRPCSLGENHHSMHSFNHMLQNSPRPLAPKISPQDLQGISLIRRPLGLYTLPMPRALRWSYTGAPRS